MEIKRNGRQANRNKNKSTFGADLIGDWTDGKYPIRLDFDGNYSWIITGKYTIIDDKTLNYESDVCERIGVSKGIKGVWQVKFPDMTTLKYTFGRYNYYTYEWSDGYNGGGTFSVENDELTLIENRGSFKCTGNIFTYITPDGRVFPGKYSVAGDKLTITYTGQPPIEYSRIPLV